jgi:hypothetical protein
MLALLGFTVAFLLGAGVCAILVHMTAIDKSQDAAFFLLWGSSLSIVACAMVMNNYRTVVTTRRHPAPIILFRTCSNLVFGLTIFITNLEGLMTGTHQNCDSGRGLLVAAVVELATATSEGWFLVLIVDLLTSLTNPFADFRRNMARYHLAVWSLGVVAFAAMLGCDCHGEIARGVCWIKVSKSGWAQDRCLWGLYLGWVLAAYVYGTVQMAYAELQIMGHASSKGLEETRAARARVVANILSALYMYMAFFALQVVRAPPSREHFLPVDLVSRFGQPTS